MQLIHCPYCGPRDEIEYHYGGQAHVAYPADPAALTDAEWAEFLFFRDNPKGPFAERWCHAAGCRSWFNAIRDTATHQMLAVYRPRRAEAGDLMSSTFRLPEGGRIDRDATVSFTFDGRRYRPPRRHPGLGPARQRRPPGHDQHQAGPAARHHGRRRRGPQRPGPGRDPVPRADAHRHHGRAVRRARGPWPARQGRLADRPDPARYDAVHVHCDVLVVGAGPAGLAAALTAARSGARVVLVDEQPEAGGSLLGSRDEIDGAPALDWVAAAVAELRALPRRHRPPAHHGLRLLRRQLRPRPREAHRPPRTRRTRAPLPAAGVAHPVAAGRGRHRRPRAPARLRRQRPARHHARRVGPDLPAPLRRAGRARVVVFTTNDSAYAAAVDLADAGVTVRRRRRRAASGPGPLGGAVRRARHRGPRWAGRDRHQRRRPGDAGARGAVRRGRARRAERDRLRPAPRVRRLEPRGAPVQPGPRQAALRRRPRRVRAGFDDPCRPASRERRRRASPSTVRSRRGAGAAEAARAAGLVADPSSVLPAVAPAPSRRADRVLWSVPEPDRAPPARSSSTSSAT